MLVFMWMPLRLTGAILCLLLGVAIPKFKEISFRPLKWISHRIATYSYGIYLGHAFFVWFALTRHNNWILFWLMWLIIPAALYHLLEHPAIQLGHKLATRYAAAPRPASNVEKPLPQTA